jgi:uncharacterized protein with HEPN domain
MPPDERGEALFLADIVEAADSVAAFLTNRTRDEFVDDDALRSAVLYKLIVIGEAARRLSIELRARHAEIPWPDLSGLRNRVAHGYFAVDWTIVWDTATQDLTKLRDQVAAILDTEFPDHSTS